MNPRSPTTTFPTSSWSSRSFATPGIEVATAQCRTEDDVIAAAEGLRRLLVQYAPVNAKVFAARPEIRIVSRFGAGFDTVNTEDAQKLGVWVANSPDYGVGEVATHALAMALALRAPPAVLRPRRARGQLALRLRRASCARAAELTLGILGLGRIGKRMAHIARNVFGRVIALRSVHHRRRLPGLRGARRRRRSSSARPTSSRCTCRSTTRRAASSGARAARS